MILCRKLFSNLYFFPVVVVGIMILLVGCKSNKQISSETTIVSDKVSNPVVFLEETSSGKYSDRYYYPTTDADGHEATGVPAGVYPETLVMVNGKNYKLADSRAWASCPFDDYYEIGKILEVDVCVKPSEDFCATGIDVPLRSGMIIFASKSDDSQIAIRTEDQLYYIFRLE